MKRAWTKARSLLAVLSMVLMVQLLFPVNAGAVDAGARVVLDSYEVLEGQMLPGEYITLRLHFQNVSPDTTATGVLITYSAANSNIMPVYGSSNQIYIHTLAPGASVTKDIDCQILDYQASTTAIMNFSLIYRDSVVYDGSNSFLIALPLESETDVEITNVMLPEQARFQAQSTGHLNVENTGNETIQAVVLHCDGNIQETQKVLELGDLMAGESIGIDLSLTFMESGNQTLSLWVEYQNANGIEFQSEAVEYAITVSEEAAAQPVQEGQAFSGGILPLAGAVLVCVVLVFAAYRMLKKNDRFVE